MWPSKDDQKRSQLSKSSTTEARAVSAVSTSCLDSMLTVGKVVRPSQKEAMKKVLFMHRWLVRLLVTPPKFTPYDKNGTHAM